GGSRRSVNGGRRAPFCGMGACQECRVLIDGRRRLACQTLCQAGMRVETRA
ncbi:(2Fe-2S)-binding protein, partial [Pseudomonas aeruginosa]